MRSYQFQAPLRACVLAVASSRSSFISVRPSHHLAKKMTITASVISCDIFPLLCSSLKLSENDGLLWKKEDYYILLILWYVFGQMPQLLQFETLNCIFETRGVKPFSLTGHLLNFTLGNEIAGQSARCEAFFKVNQPPTSIVFAL